METPHYHHSPVLADFLCVLPISRRTHHVIFFLLFLWPSALPQIPPGFFFLASPLYLLHCLEENLAQFVQTTVHLGIMCCAQAVCFDIPLCLQHSLELTRFELSSSICGYDPWCSKVFYVFPE